jgi:hypothetical protein
MKLFLDLIHESLGYRHTWQRVPRETDWLQLFKIVQKQAMAGVCFAEGTTADGVKNLPTQRYLHGMTRFFD